ncbi:MAG: LysR family transcriptional regulator [Polyangiaceae bacterium]
MHIPWDAVQLFLAVAESGSVTGGAKKLRITQPTASRRLVELEATLGEPLFVRGVAGVVLTPYGESLLAPARRMAEWSGEVDRTAERSNAAPNGVVRLTAPPGIAFDVLAPFAAALRRKLPEITLEVVSSIQYLDLGRREADLALRMGTAPRELVTVAQLEHGVGVFAAPAYAKRLPRKPRLADIDWIAWAAPLDHLSPNPELARLVPGFRPAFASDDFLVQLAATAAGLGAMFLGRVRHRYSRSELVELDVDVGPLQRTLSLVCAKSALDIPRVRAVADALAEELTHAAKLSRRQRSAQ